MAQTRYLRSVIKLSWRERLMALRGRLAVSAVVRMGELTEIKIAPFPGNAEDAERWIETGSRTGDPRRRVHVSPWVPLP
jgi:hypothetical protein